MEKYEKKIKKLKKAIKNLVVENSSLVDHISDIQNTIDKTKIERTFLLRKLIEHEPESFAEFASNEQEHKKPKKRRNSSTDSSIGKPYARKFKVQQPLRKQVQPPFVVATGSDGRKIISIKQEIKQENLTFFDDND